MQLVLTIICTVIDISDEERSTSTVSPRSPCDNSDISSRDNEEAPKNNNNIDHINMGSQAGKHTLSSIEMTIPGCQGL